MALKSHCCVVEKVTTYVVLANMDANEATVTKLQLTFREERGSALFTNSSTGTIQDVLSRVVCHLQNISSNSDM